MYENRSALTLENQILPHRQFLLVQVISEAAGKERLPDGHFWLGVGTLDRGHVA
jgi:hypothetical protein